MSVAVSVVIPVHNQPDQLARLLASLDRQQDAPPFEVIIVDDCSTDDTFQIGQAWAQDRAARCIRLPHNRGPAAARNVGLRAAAAPVVAYIDSDCVAEPAWLDRLTRALGPDPRIVGAGGRVLPLEPAGVIARYYTAYGILDPHPHKLYVVTANACFRRQPLLDIGGFDETLAQPGGEDIGICIQLWQRGGRFAIADDAVVRHDYRDTLADFRRTWRRYGYGSAYVCRRHLGEHEPPRDRAALSEETGWNPNPLFVPPIPWRHLRPELNAAYRLCRENGGSRRDALCFAWLRRLQLTLYPRAWQQGYRDAARLD